MSTTENIAKIEAGLQALIARVNDIEAELARMKRKAIEDEDWVGRISGSFKDDPGYDAIIELGRQIRKSDFS